jgi:N4-gp56 family major capsid protein
MALTSNQLGRTEAANFIPQLWSDEVIATYKKNLVLANLVTKISHKGKKGDTINIPAPDRKAASQKATDTSVTLIAHTDSNVAVSINRHFEYSVLIEDIAEVQALSSMRKFHTDDAGYALATRVDTDLAEVASNLNGGSGTAGDAGWNKAQVWNATTGVLTDWLRSGSGNASSLSAAGNELAIRAMIEKLDLQDIPMDNRAFVLTPRQYSDILGVSRFTEQQFIGSGDAIKTGKVGMIYGVDIFVTNNLDTTQNATTPADHDLGLLIHKEALVCAEQVGVRTQTQYKQEYLGDLFTADTLYGVKEMRDNAGFAFVTTR